MTRHQQEMERFHAAVAPAGAKVAPKKQGLVMLNPGELSGYLKDPDGKVVEFVAEVSAVHPLW